jgi:P-type Ca2+ transporter type 2C
MSLSPMTDGGYLAVKTPSSPTNSDDATLHSRSGSFIEPANRFRSNSTNTYVERSDFELEPPEEALKADKGNENDFLVPNNPFAFTPGQLNKQLNPKSLSAFKALGGLQGLAKGLRTSITAGLSVDEVHLDGQVTFAEAVGSDGKKFDEVSLDRQDIEASREVAGQFEDRLRVFKDNRLPERKPNGIWVLIWRTYNDKILILLTAAAIISLSLGLYETFSGGSSVDWVEGVAICVAIIIVVTVGALNDYQKERQFIRLNKRVSLVASRQPQANGLAER